jgi:hypothetical protein
MTATTTTSYTFKSDDTNYSEHSLVPILVFRMHEAIGVLAQSGHDPEHRTGVTTIIKMINVHYCPCDGTVNMA